MKKIVLTILGLAVVMLLPTSCQKNEFGTVDLTMPDDPVTPGYEPVNASYDYSEMVGLYTQADFNRVKASLSDGTAADPVKKEFENLKNSPYVDKNRKATPHQQIVRGDATGTIEGKQTYTDAMRDAAAAYQMALLWQLTGDDEYAATASKILDDWAAVCTEITSNDFDYNLSAGAQGFTFALAGQMLKSYSAWSDSQKDTFKNWMKNVFGKINHTFLENHGTNSSSFSSSHKSVPQDLWAEHYWSNWDMVTLTSYLAIGILCEDNSYVNYAVNYFYQGDGNGAIKKLVRGTHDDPLGTGEKIAQNQESGRDQGHAQMSTAVCLHLCQMAYSLYQKNPSISQLDFFTAENNAVLHMAEYVALSNLLDGSDNANSTGSYLIPAYQMPFAEYHHCPGGNRDDDNDHIQLSDEQRGGCRPGWEIILNRFRGQSGFIYSQRMADKIRPEGGSGDSRYGSNSGAFDQLGWNTLMLYQE